MDTAESSASRTQREECFYCLDSGYHFIASVDIEGEETIEAYPCRRCSGEVTPAVSSEQQEEEEAHRITLTRS
jgi:hypothetical protein